MTTRLLRLKLIICVCVLLRKQSHLRLGCPGVMFKEEDPLLSRPSLLPLEGVNLCPTRDRSLADDRVASFQLPPYPSEYSYPPQGYQDNFCSKPDGPEDVSRGHGSLSERNPSFESLELGFTELLPPLYPPRGVPRPSSPAPPSPSPWLDSPYLSSSPSPSHSSSLSPFPASSPISTSPLPTLSHSPYHHCPPYPQEMCPYPPYEGWDHHAPLQEERERQEGQLGFSGGTPMHNITLEEVNEFIGEDIRAFQTGPHTDSRPG